MNERLRLQPISGGREMEIHVTRREQFTAGGGSTKYRVEGTSQRRKVWYVERVYTRKVVENWQRFRNAGLPVVPELYRGSDGGLYADDLRADGSGIYGKSLLHELNDRRHPREPHPADERFLEIMSSDQKDSIKEQIGKYVVIANQFGLTLPIDDSFDLVVHPNRHDNPWELIILDLSRAGTYDPFDVEDPHTVENAQFANRRRGDAAFEAMGVVASKLRRRRS